MIVWWSMKAGAHAAAHRHPHEQMFVMLSGRMEFRLGSDTRMCGPGDLGVIPGGVEHEAWFHEDTEVIDVFAPPREDFLTPEIGVHAKRGERVGLPEAARGQGNTRTRGERCSPVGSTSTS